jgi:hypothetical protein
MKWRCVRLLLEAHELEAMIDLIKLFATFIFAE